MKVQVKNTTSCVNKLLPGKVVSLQNIKYNWVVNKLLVPAANLSEPRGILSLPVNLHGSTFPLMKSELSVAFSKSTVPSGMLNTMKDNHCSAQVKLYAASSLFSTW